MQLQLLFRLLRVELQYIHPFVLHKHPYGHNLHKEF